MNYLNLKKLNLWQWFVNVTFNVTASLKAESFLFSEEATPRSLGTGFDGRDVSVLQRFFK